MNVEIIGFLAAILTTAAFVPQAYKIWKLKSADGVSLTMYLIMFLGVTLWEIYGLFISSAPIIVANFITASLLIMILYFKIKPLKK
jgi:MtN3 and saliva related transmembrane protein